MSTRRAALAATTLGTLGPAGGPGTNAGLWLDKYLDGSKGSDAKRALVAEVASLAPTKVYEAAFARWRTSLNALYPPVQDGAVLRLGRATVRQRMAVGLGAEAVLENSITLHRTYGVPIIPGSALKGLAASYAHRRLTEPGWRRPSKAEAQEEAEEKRPMSRHSVLFGAGHSAGYVTFLDAWYVPRTGGPLHPDVLTVHHQAYYGGRLKSPTDREGFAPADWDSPIPAPFLSATGSYLVALAGPEAWVDAAFSILEWALDDEGIGAKTSSGYGRMDLRAEQEMGRVTLGQRDDAAAVAAT